MPFSYLLNESNQAPISYPYSTINMFPQPLVQTVSIRGSAGTNFATGGPAPEISELNSLAVQSLGFLFDEKEKLFCQRIVLTKHGFRKERTSRKRTMIALLGLQRLVESGATHPFNVAAIQDVILRDTSWVASAGDLGLLIWFTAVCAPEKLFAVIEGFDLDGALDACVDGRQGHTQGLAWFLTGVAQARRASSGTLSDLTDVAARAYHLLLSNQSQQGLFCHVASPWSIRGILPSRFGTFADQMHAIYALTTFAREFDIEQPLESASACANSVCALQGDRGEWWFLYDTHRGCVANRYPVFSAHQDGVAPTALLALEEITGRGFHGAVWNGLSWVAANNELGVDLRDFDPIMIWDSIDVQRRITQYWETACSLLHIPWTPPTTGLRIRYEARPDHFGWLLYAFGKFGLPKNKNIYAKTKNA